MNKQLVFTITAIILSTLVLSACNLPGKPTAEVTVALPDNPGPTSTPTPVIDMCYNLYFPNTLGDSWGYAGSTSATEPFTRADFIASGGTDHFTVQSTISDVSYNVDYSCTEAGLIAVDPIQQYLGGILSNLKDQVSITQESNSGITLPKNINPGDTWQQIVEWKGSAQGIDTNGRLVFDYTAVGYETVTVPAGTFEALKVKTSIRIEISSLRIDYGSYTVTTWMVPNIGIVKSQGYSNIPNVQFTDSLELTGFTLAY